MALVGGDWSASRSVCLTPKEKAPGLLKIEGWAGPIASLNGMEQEIFLTLPEL
jgi:hypothetical protein